MGDRAGAHIRFRHGVGFRDTRPVCVKAGKVDIKATGRQRGLVAACNGHRAHGRICDTTLLEDSWHDFGGQIMILHKRSKEIDHVPMTI